ncbi:MAG: hypothetical protein VB144_04225 [Clostridia bacterium]|nr:hypothetical protein [Clostridia bacterium]
MSQGFGRILAVGLWTFVLSAAMSSGSGAVAEFMSLWFSVGVLIAIIGAGILFDIVGTAATAASEAPMNAMAANRVHGATEALALVRNAPAVASFCNDFVGDICGTVSGAVGATIVLRFSVAATGGADMHTRILAARVLPTLAVAIISALTVAGKAAGKRFAIESADGVILQVGRVAATFNSIIGRDGRGKSKNKRRQKNGH